MARRALRSFYRWANDVGVSESEWTRGLRTPRRPDSVVTVADDNVLAARLDTYDDTWTGVPDRALLFTLWSTGMRRGEVTRKRIGTWTPTR